MTELAVIGASQWKGLRRRLGRAFFPAVIVWMTLIPILLIIWLGPTLPPGRISETEGARLRMLPVLFISLQVVAWQYRWPQVIAFAGATALLTLLTAIITPTGLQAPPTNAVMLVIVQTFTCLMIGLYITFLVEQLRTQQASLEAANHHLRHHAATLEHLAISRERNRVARELHDTLAHTLTGLTVQLETAKAYWAVDPEAAQTMLDRSLEAARQGVQETRRALRSLRATPLDDLGLVLALRQLAISAAERANLQVELSLPDTPFTLVPYVEQGIYRIAQEAVTNVVHHAAARHLWLRLDVTPDHLTLHIADDGRGIDPAHEMMPGHFGLVGMRERAALLGATLTITSQRDGGTAIQLVVERHLARVEKRGSPNANRDL